MTGWTTLKFRDGEREVPNHIASLLDGDETYTMTYEEAVQLVNKRNLGDRLQKAQDDAIRQHFRNLERE